MAVQGYLHKHHKGRFWDKRYFILQGKYLNYKKGEKASKLHASIDVDQITRVTRCIGSDLEFEIQVRTQEREEDKREGTREGRGQERGHERWKRTRERDGERRRDGETKRRRYGMYE